MTNLEVVIKAINQALDNGWKPPFMVSRMSAPDNVSAMDFALTTRNIELLIGNFTTHPTYVFHHSFAKAFWSRDKSCYHTAGANRHRYNEKCGIESWQYHLREMVMYEDPIDYLRKFIENGN